MFDKRFFLALSLLVIARSLSIDALANTNESLTPTQHVNVTAETTMTTVSVAGGQIIGDPSTLYTIDKLNLSGHNIEVSRWKSTLGIDTVMQKLSLQVPQETLAWGDAGVMYLHWTTIRQSHFLMVMPIDDNVVEFTISSIDVFRHHPSGYDLKNTFHDRDSYRELKSFFSSHFLSAALLLDIKDHAAESDGFTMLFELRKILSWTDAELKNHLKSHGWHLTGEIEQASISNASRTIEATRYQQYLRIDLIAAFGKTFVHINQTGSLGLERYKRTN